MERTVPSTTSEPINLNQSIIVRAGAGAGKTTALTEHVLDVAREFRKTQERYPRIVVTTFTKKATQELKERLVLLALQKHHDLLEFVNSSSALKISTIHGILDQFLRQYGGAIELDPSFSVINSSRASQLARQVIRKILLNHPSKESLQTLIDEFSFKKLEKLCRDYYRIKMQHADFQAQSQESLSLLNQLYVQSLAQDIQKLVESIVSEETNPKWTAYASQMQTLSQDLLEQDWTKNFESFKNFYNSIASVTKTKKIQEETNDFKKSLEKKLTDLFEDPAYHPETAQLFAEKFKLAQILFEDFSTEFLRTKIKSALLEINDLELLALKMAREFPQTAKAFAEEWDYWLIDEYQDTSPVQVELIEVLSQEKPQYVVGDPQQSIYLFRGARSEVFQNREAEILAKAGRKDEKIKNYRSRPELLEFLNDFFLKFKIPFSPMMANYKEDIAPDPKASVATFFIAQKEKTALEFDAECLAIAEHVQSLVRQDVKLEEICVLARTNKILSEVSRALSHFGLANHVHISSGFYERREIQDALALYRFLVHPHNNLNLLILLRSPWFSVDEQFLIDRLPEAKNSFWSYLEPFKVEHSKLAALSRYFQDVSEQGIGMTFLKALTECGIFHFSKHFDSSGRLESNLWKLVSLLREQEQKPGFNPLDFLAQIESDILADQDSEGDAVAAVEPQRINLMTIHASKGLQFRHVIVPRVNKRPRSPQEPDFLFEESEKKWSMKIPLGEIEKMTGSLVEKNYVERQKSSEISEHARVLYVALTRAIDSVFLSWTEPAEANSWAEMMCWDFSQGKHEATKYSYEVKTQVPTPEPWQTIAFKTEALRKPWLADAKLGTAQSVSVTELLEKNSKLVSVQQSEQKWMEHFKVISHGSLTHKLMQALKYSNNVDALIEQWFQGRQEEVVKALDFMKALQTPPLGQLIQNGYVEMGFSYKQGDKIIDGQIDLWGIIDGKVWIVDYKTGSTRYRDKAFLQMEYYARALEKSDMIPKNAPIHLSVIYPFAEKVYNQNFISQENQ